MERWGEEEIGREEEKNEGSEREGEKMRSKRGGEGRK